MSKGMSLDELVGYTSQDRAGNRRQQRKAGTIAGWPVGRRDGATGRAEILVWLHTKSKFYTVWQHKWPRTARNRDNPDLQDLYWGKFRCFESDEVLKKQRFYDRETGKREHPPVVCPICRLTAHVRELVENGDLGFTEELFAYEVGGKRIVLHAGGIYGGYTGNKISEADQKRIRDAGIKKGWEEAAVVARQKYVFNFVDQSNPDAGPQAVVESESLGKSLIGEITNQRRGAGVSGDPLVNPYAFMLVFDSNEKPTTMYKASAMPLVKLSDQVKRQITDEPPAEVGHIYEPWNVRALWASMEQACLKPNAIDWEHVFGPAIKLCDENGVYRGDKDLPIGGPSRPAMTDLGAVTAPSDAKPEDFCESCKAYIGPDALTCKGCGAQYESDEPPF